jgi:diguanylate cyclase (GGDEF)-like protein
MDDTTDHTIVTTIPEFEKDSKEKHPYILFQQGPLFGKMVLLQPGNLILGRSDESDIVINDEGISRKHVKLSYDRGQTIATDLKSTNGTYVNGKRITSQELNNEDKIQISSSTIIKYIYADKLDESTQKELYDMGHLDPLTNAYNKRHLLDRLLGEFSFARRKGVPLSLIMLDVDLFKNINDTYGHPCGDFILMHIAKLANSIIRDEDIFARYGGEEFTIVLKDTDREGAKILAERFRRLVEEHEFIFEQNAVAVRISLGVATLEKKNYSDVESMISAADQCLYKSKNEGRNRTTCD